MCSTIWSAGWRLSIMLREQEDSVVDAIHTRHAIHRYVDETIEAANQKARIIALAVRIFVVATYES